MTGWAERGYVLEVDEPFSSPDLDRARWFPYYLPQWSSRERSAARYATGSGLALRIDEDQQPWHPELDGPLRVSALQTGVFSGPLGSSVGQHRFHRDAVVQEEQPSLALWTPHLGVVEIRCRALDLDGFMVALWLIGFEDEPSRSAEVCVCEIFGSEVGDEESLVGMGVHPFGDPAIVDDFEKVRVPIDAREMHDYAVEWTAESVTFSVDGTEVKRVAQSPAYPLQLMVTLYELERRPGTAYPVVWPIERIRGWSPAR